MVFKAHLSQKPHAAILHGFKKRIVAAQTGKGKSAEVFEIHSRALSPIDPGIRGPAGSEHIAYDRCMAAHKQRPGVDPASNMSDAGALWRAAI